MFKMLVTFFLALKVATYLKITIYLKKYIINKNSKTGVHYSSKCFCIFKTYFCYA